MGATKNAKYQKNTTTTRVGRPTSEDRLSKGHIDLYGFKFEEDFKKPLSILNPCEVEKLLLSKGFIRERVNIDIKNINIEEDFTDENRKRLGVLWFMYSHPSIPKILNSKWNLGICLKSTLAENPKISLSFSMYHDTLENPLDFEEDYSISINAIDRNKGGIELALIHLFEKYRDLQKFILIFNRKTTLNNTTKKEVSEILYGARLNRPFIQDDPDSLSDIDCSAIDSAISREGSSIKLMDYMAFFNHYLIDGKNEITYTNSNGSREVASAVTSHRRLPELRRSTSSSLYNYMKKKV